LGFGEELQGFTQSWSKSIMANTIQERMSRLGAGVLAVVGLAVGYHSVQSPENNTAIMDGVRKTYAGPLALACDLMVVNVTKDDIKVRMASADEYVLPPNVTDAYKKAPRTNPTLYLTSLAASSGLDGIASPVIRV
jgi:hypothetical protein